MDLPKIVLCGVGSAAMAELAESAGLGTDAVHDVGLDACAVELPALAEVWNAPEGEALAALAGGAAAVVLTYTVDDRTSFNGLRRWLSLLDALGYGSLRFVLGLGTAADVPAHHAAQREAFLARRGLAHCLVHESQAVVDGIARVVAAVEEVRPIKRARGSSGSVMSEDGGGGKRRHGL